MRFSHWLIIITLVCCLGGCSYLCKYCEYNGYINERVDESVQETQNFLPLSPSRFVSESKDDIGNRSNKAFFVVDNLDVDPAPVRSNPKTFIKVSVPRFSGHKSGVNLKSKTASNASIRSSIKSKDSQGTVIYFDFDSYRLRRAEIEKLKQLSKRYKDQSVSVSGYTCWKGSKEYNDLLALKRARSVAAYLREMGITVKTVSGDGKYQYISKTNIALNRRVTVTPCAKKPFQP